MIYLYAYINPSRSSRLVSLFDCSNRFVFAWPSLAVRSLCFPVVTLVLGVHTKQSTFILVSYLKKLLFYAEIYVYFKAKRIKYVSNKKPLWNGLMSFKWLIWYESDRTSFCQFIPTDFANRWTFLIFRTFSERKGKYGCKSHLYPMIHSQVIIFVGSKT